MHALLLLMAGFLYTGCSTAPDTAKTEKTDSTYTFTGHITGMDSGKIYLYHRQQPEPGNLDSAMLHHGDFSFSGKTDTPQICLIGIEDHGDVSYKKSFFLENAKIALAARKDSLSAALISGGPVQTAFVAYEKQDSSLKPLYAVLHTAYKKAKDDKNSRMTDSLDKVYDSLDKIHQLASKKYVAAHPGSYVSAYIINSDFSYNPNVPELDSLYKGLDSNIRVSYFGRKIKSVIEKNLLTAVGQPAPDFTQADVDGKPVTLSSLRGNYVLVDFWASWCGPCRQENPSVVKAYKKFHPKQFTIVGVSLDDTRADWLKAIQKDGLYWTQLSDLKGWKNAVAATYGINGIPMNFLLDKQGKIIAKGLRGEELYKKLEESLK